MNKWLVLGITLALILGVSHGFPAEDGIDRLEERADACSQPAKTGPCRGKFTRYYYNSDEEECQEFIYGGCRGNDNNFKTIEECENQCGLSDEVEEVEERSMNELHGSLITNLNERELVDEGQAEGGRQKRKTCKRCYRYRQCRRCGTRMCCRNRIRCVFYKC